MLRKEAFRFDILKRLRAILVRRDLLTHIKSSLPKMEPYTKSFGTWQWHADTYNLNEDGTTKEGTPFRAEASTGLGEDAEEVDSLTTPGLLSGMGGCSTYTCYAQLTTFCTQLMRNEHEVLLCKLVQNYIPGKALNLATSDAEKIREIMSDITEKYKADFPPQVGTPAHKATHTVENGDNLEVTVAQRIENVEGYKAELARYNELASQHEMAAIQEHIDHRIVLVVDSLEATKTRIADTLKRYPLMREKKRKLYMYDTTLDGPLNWTTIKKRRLSVWAGAGPGLCTERLQAWKGGRAGT